MKTYLASIGCFAVALTTLIRPAFGQATPGPSNPSSISGQPAPAVQPSATQPQPGAPAPAPSAAQPSQPAQPGQPATAAQPAAGQSLNVAVQPGQPLQITIQPGGAQAYQPGMPISEAAGSQTHTQEVGVVTLQGTVRDAAQKAAIEEHIIMVPGVTVENQLHVAGPVVPDENTENNASSAGGQPPNNSAGPQQNNQGPTPYPSSYPNQYPNQFPQGQHP